jgi:transcriptional regulator with XRE-family HTH domain
MKSIHELLERIRKAIPEVKSRLDEPDNPEGEWYLDIVHKGKGIVVQWREGGPVGLSSMGKETEIGQKADELYSTLETAATRLVALLTSGASTEPPAGVTLRELRAERNFSQTKLAELTGMHQPAISRLEQKGVSTLVVGTLLAVIKAMGGKLVIQAEFPDGVVKKLRVQEDDLLEEKRDLLHLGVLDTQM